MNNFKEYVNSFQAVSNLKLDGVRRLAEKVGNPQRGLKFIHVAGTNGKGSVCAFLQSILTASGIKTGKFISPNMLDVCERISIDGMNISESEMDSLMQRLSEASHSVYEETGKLPTQFEIWTVAAFMHFAEKRCGAVVLETGLGGRMDATNIIEKPLFSVITRIDMDHMNYLGNTLESIAAEKCGIIKKGCPVITLDDERVSGVIEKAAAAADSPLIIAKKVQSCGFSDMSELFDYGDIRGIKCGLPGVHQLENASLAIECALQMGIDEKFIAVGIENSSNPGRLERISENPTVIFDGAHNGSGIDTLTAAIRRYFPNREISFIFGAMADKDLNPTMKSFKNHGFGNSRFFTVTVEDNPRAASQNTLAELFTANGFSAQPCKSIGEAYEKAASENGVTVICGSLYLYKDLAEYLKN